MYNVNLPRPVYHCKTRKEIIHGSHNLLGALTWVGSVFYLVRQQGMIFTNILSNYVKTCNKLLL
jgi:hypothetical protein